MISPACGLMDIMGNLPKTFLLGKLPIMRLIEHFHVPPQMLEVEITNFEENTAYDHDTLLSLNNVHAMVTATVVKGSSSPLCASVYEAGDGVYDADVNFSDLFPTAFDTFGSPSGPPAASCAPPPYHFVDFSRPVSRSLADCDSPPDRSNPLDVVYEDDDDDDYAVDVEENGVEDTNPREDYSCMRPVADYDADDDVVLSLSRLLPPTPTTHSYALVESVSSADSLHAVTTDGPVEDYKSYNDSRKVDVNVIHEDQRCPQNDVYQLQAVFHPVCSDFG